VWRERFSGGDLLPLVLLHTEERERSLRVTRLGLCVVGAGNSKHVGRTTIMRTKRIHCRQCRARAEHDQYQRDLALLQRELGREPIRACLPLTPGDARLTFTTKRS
jgi:hypothetical protein